MALHYTIGDVSSTCRHQLYQWPLFRVQPPDITTVFLQTFPAATAAATTRGTARLSVCLACSAATGTFQCIEAAWPCGTVVPAGRGCVGDWCGYGARGDAIWCGGCEECSRGPGVAAYRGQKPHSNGGYQRKWPGGLKNAFELLSRRALKSSPVNKIHLFQCMCKVFYCGITKGTFEIGGGVGGLRIGVSTTLMGF